MKIIDQYHEVLAYTQNPLELIETAGRVCYKSEDKIQPGSAGPFVSKICKTFKHESVIEHASVTVRFVTNRGVTHELVRHRLSSYSQESTRYCNYDKEKFGKEITVIRPVMFAADSPKYGPWYQGCMAAETAYFSMMSAGASPQEAREVLPNSLKTEIVHTANFREWLHILKLRTSEKAHPQIRTLMLPLAAWFHQQWSEIFEPIAV